VGIERAHPCLSREWILKHFSGDRGKAQKEYGKFVREGMGKGSIWAELKGQVLLGGVAFVEGLMDYLKKHKDIPEIPRNQHFVNRPELSKIFTEGVLRDRGWMEGSESGGGGGASWVHPAGGRGFSWPALYVSG